MDDMVRIIEQKASLRAHYSSTNSPSLSSYIRLKTLLTLRTVGAPGGITRATMTQCESVQTTANEFLRVFWSSVLPAKPGDLSASALSTPQQKAAKAERMKGYLDKTLQRIDKVVDGSSPVARGAEEQKRVQAVRLARRSASCAIGADAVYLVS